MATDVSALFLKKIFVFVFKPGSHGVTAGSAQPSGQTGGSEVLFKTSWASASSTIY